MYLRSTSGELEADLRCILSKKKMMRHSSHQYNRLKYLQLKQSSTWCKLAQLSVKKSSVQGVLQNETLSMSRIICCSSGKKCKERPAREMYRTRVVPERKCLYAPLSGQVQGSLSYPSYRFTVLQDLLPDRRDQMNGTISQLFMQVVPDVNTGCNVKVVGHVLSSLRRRLHSSFLLEICSPHPVSHVGKPLFLPYLNLPLAFLQGLFARLPSCLAMRGRDHYHNTLLAYWNNTESVYHGNGN